MVLIKRLTHLVLLGAITTDMAAATFVRHDAQGKLIPATRSEEVPVETSFTLVDGSITTIVIGTDTYSVSYNSDGEVDHLTLVTEIVSTRRTQQVVRKDFEFFDRQLQTCEETCEGEISDVCESLSDGCTNTQSALYGLLGDTVCNNLDSLCEPTGTEAGCDRTCAPECVDDDDCTEPNEVCCPALNICEVPDITGACGDPHMTGFLGQKFDFTGEDGEWYCLLDDGPSMHVNIRVTAPVPSLPVITYITGLSVITVDAGGVDHIIEISVKDPHKLDSSCPVGVSRCLADGALSVQLDGQESLISPGEVALGPDVAISAVNLPGACRTFGFEKYWERKKLQYAGGGRRLDTVGFMHDMGEWILADPTATNMAECAQYIASAGETGLFEHESEHASFQIMTPTGTIRLNHGRLHQLPMRDPTGQFDLPDHLSWQMNVAIDHHDVSLEATGILGETVVPTVDANGKYIMKGMDAIRGSQQDYRVAGPFDTVFAQGHQ